MPEQALEALDEIISGSEEIGVEELNTATSLLESIYENVLQDTNVCCVIHKCCVCL